MQRLGHIDVALPGFASPNRTVQLFNGRQHSLQCSTGQLRRICRRLAQRIHIGRRLVRRLTLGVFSVD